MRTYVFTLLAVLLIAPLVQSQVTLEMSPIEAHSTITDVTLYRNRASITRTAVLDLDAGGYSVFFRDLTSAVYLNSVQAHVSDNSSLLSVDTTSKPVARNTSELVANIDAEIEEVELKLSITNANGQGIGLQIQMLKTLIDQGSNDKTTTVDLEALDKQVDFIGRKMSNLVADSVVNENRTDDLKKDLQTLRLRRKNIVLEQRNQIDAIVDIGVPEPCTVVIELTYLVNHASWKPVYSIRANNEGDKVAIEYDAEISQLTGEQWTDVSLTLSTAQPQQSISPPQPRPWYVDVYVPPPPTATLEMRSRSRESSDARYGVTLTETSEIVGMASANASVVGDGPAVSFVLPRTVTVVSNAQDKQTTSITTIDTNAEHYHIAVPMLTDRVFIRSDVTNESDFILLPGVASIFHGGDYVGKTTLSTVAPNETFALDLGVDPSVTASRTLVEKISSTTGLFASGKQTVYDFRITISNGHDSVVDMRVWDRIPVSRNEEIEVSMKNLSEALSTDPVYLDVDRPRGLLRWDLHIPAQKTGDQSFVMRWRVEVARSNNIEMTPLPE